MRIPPVRGTIRCPCLRCGEMCWVAPSLQNEKVDGVICTRCLTDKEKAEANFVIKEEVYDEYLKTIEDLKAVELKNLN